MSKSRNKGSELPALIRAGGLNIGAMERSFRDFLSYATIQSKDYGVVPLRMYDAQEYFLRELFDGLRDGVHWFVCGKGRQQGITTICLLLDCFWAAAIPGVQGAVVFDTHQNKEKFRILLKGILDRLREGHPEHSLPVKKHDRDFIEFENGNVLDYLTAGVKKGQGTLGRSRALNYVHATEVCSFGDEDAFEAFRDCFSDIFPARCYLFESTAKGHNLFADLWDEAGDDPIAKKQIFVGWWRKGANAYAAGTALYRRYGYAEKSGQELEIEREVLRLYGHQISLEQWAWFRHRSDPRARADFVSDDESKAVVVAQEHPAYPEQMFQQTGSQFVSPVQLKAAVDEAHKHPFKGYRFYFGEDITAVRHEPVNIGRMAHLRVWEEPVVGARYVLSADPAFASSGESDFFVINVCRCYADGIDQVAEFAERNMEDYQFAWTMAYLSNLYGNCRIILEIDGPGEAVLMEFRHLKTMLEAGRFGVNNAEDLTPEDIEQNRRLKNFLRGVGEYMYHRPDSFGGGYNAQWKQTPSNRLSIFVQMRDQFAMGALRLYSLECLNEARRLVQEGGSIQPGGKAKDDRITTICMAVRCWIEFERMNLLADGRFREVERERAEPIEEMAMNQYMTQIMHGNIARKEAERRSISRLAARPQWRAGVWRGRR